MKRMADLARLPLTGPALALTLAACGGGGSPPSEPVRPEPDQPEPEVDLVLDTFVASDLLIFAGSEPPLRAIATCDDSACTYRFEGEAVTDSIEFAGQVRTDRRFDEPTRTRNRVTLGVNRDSRDVEELGTFFVESHGGWMQYSGFGVSYGTVRGDEPPIDALVSSVSIGEGAGGNPLTGLATWTGAMAGKTRTNDTVEGDATISVDFARVEVDVLFDEIADIESEESYEDLEWRGLDMRDGGFSGDGIEGRFYGPQHQEVGGVFERDAIVGGFAAGR